MAGLSNIQFNNGTTQRTTCSDINFYNGSALTSMKEAYFYNGSSLTLIWTKGAITYSKVTPSNGAVVAKYVPAQNMTLEKFYVYQPASIIEFNYIAGVWNEDGTNLSRSTSTANLSIDASTYITVDSVNYYKSTHTYNGTGPSLIANNTYYLYLGQGYMGATTRVIISGDTTGSYVNAYEWQLNSTQVIVPASNLVTGVTVVMGVTAL